MGSAFASPTQPSSQVSEESFFRVVQYQQSQAIELCMESSDFHALGSNTPNFFKIFSSLAAVPFMRVILANGQNVSHKPGIFITGLNPDLSGSTLRKQSTKKPQGFEYVHII